jgi:hypothetical protein
MQNKMMVYDRVISDLNAARLRGTSYPIVHSLIEASLGVTANVSGINVDSCAILTPASARVTTNDTDFPFAF